MIDVILKKGKEKAVLQKHPWVFSGAIDRIMGTPQNGDVVRVLATNKDFLAYGFFNQQSRVAVRLLEWQKNQSINADWYENKIKNALHRRKHLLNHPATNAYRLIFSEADFLPGLIVDAYADFLSVQILSAGIEKAKDTIIQILCKQLHPKGIFDRSDATAQNHEGIPTANGLLWGQAPQTFITITENTIKYHINIAQGQKSGFYCDQRDNRHRVAQYADHKTVLDCFSYSGGFTLNALHQGAKQVTSVDSSALAIETLKENIRLNGFDPARHLAILSDVNKQLRVFKTENKTFDLIILDPPKYAPTRSSVDKAARAYKDLNRLALGLLNSGGLLATFSCSGAINIELFKQILAWAALDAGKEVQVIAQFSQPEDHPLRLSFPEGEYLKGLLLRII